jgi:hypothetical protein
MGEFSSSPVPPDIMERRSVALSRPSPGVVVQEGESGFKEELAKVYDAAENNAVEQLVQLKTSHQRSRRHCRCTVRFCLEENLNRRKGCCRRNATNWRAWVMFDGRGFLYQ